MKLIINILLATVLLLFSGCNGRGSSDSGVAKVKIFGKVIDGYIMQSTVFADVNNNGFMDSFEPRTQTDENGYYEFEVNNGSLTNYTQIIAYLGTEQYTNRDFNAIAKNMVINKDNAGAINLTGITTLVVDRYSYLKNELKIDNFTLANTDVATFLEIDSAILNKDIIIEIGNNYENFRSNLKLYQYLEKELGSSQTFENSKTEFYKLAKDLNLSNSTKDKIEDYIGTNYMYPVLISKNEVEVNENIALSPDLFTVINPATGLVVSDKKLFDGSTEFTGSLDFETEPIKNLILRVGSKDYNVKVTAKDANELPTNITLSFLTINENSVAGTEVGTLSTTDADSADSFIYTIADNSTFAINGNQLVVKSGANINYEGGVTSYSISITSKDSSDNSFTKQFTITVNNINEAPVISDASFSVTEDVSTNGTLNATDPDGDAYTFSLVGNDSHGTLNLANNGYFAYSPSANFNGTGTFSFKACDSRGLCSVAKTVTLSVSAVNDTPIPTSHSLISLNEDASSATATLLASDPESNAMTFQLLTSPSKLTIGWNENGTFSYVPKLNENGSDSLTYRVCDSLGACSATQTLNFTIAAVNDVPTAINLSSTSISENASTSTSIGTFSSADVDIGDTFIYAFVGGSGSVDNNSFSISDNNLRVNTALDYETKTSYQIRVRTTDVGGAYFEQPFTVNVTNITDAVPTLANSTINIQDTTVGIIGRISVVSSGDSAISSYAITSDATTKCSVNSSGDISLTGTVATGIYALKITATNTQGTSSEATITINVSATPVPVLNNATFSIAENITGTVSLGSVPIISTGGGITSYAISNALDSGGKFTLDTSTGDITTASDATFDFETKTSYSFQVTATNGTTTSSPVTITINITNINETPTATTSTITLYEDETYLTTLTGSDIDAATTLTFIKISDPLHGALNSFNTTTGAISYTPSTNYNGSDSFKYKVSDGSLESAEQTVNITITPINDAPTFTSPETTILATEDTLFSQIFTVSDIENDAMTVSISSNMDNLPITLTKNSGTQWTLSGTMLDEHVGTHTVLLSVSDGDKSTAHSLAINISNVNDAPYASLSSSNTIVGIGKTVTFVINGVSDGDLHDGSTAINLTNVVSSNTGALTVVAHDADGSDGTISIDLVGGSVGGTSVVTFILDDGLGLSNSTKTYTINVAVDADSGFIAYHAGKLQGNYPDVTLGVDGGNSITYTWDGSNKWYHNSSLGYILLPVQAIDGATESLAIGASTNAIKAKLGHYYVRKVDYISHGHIANSNHSSTISYTTASGGSKQASNSNFQHDPVHHFFVSRMFISQTDDFNSPRSELYTTWNGASPSWVNAPTTQNENYASNKTNSTYTNSDAVQIDSLNNGNKNVNMCALRYGEGWRIPTSYEMGKIDNDVPGSSPLDLANNQGFIPAYVGGNEMSIWTSTIYPDGENSRILVMKSDTGQYVYANIGTDTKEIRCVYSIY